MSKNDSGPAFPVAGIKATDLSENTLEPSKGYTWFREPVDGLSLRDWFAAKADISNSGLTADILTTLTGGPVPDDKVELLKWAAKGIAVARYILADAMLAEREKDNA